MITFFHNLGNSFAAKLIFGLLGLSMMLFWGLGGLTNLSLRSDNPIQIGSVEITAAHLRGAFETERQRLSAFVPGGYLSPEQAVSMGVLDMVVQKMIEQHMQEKLVAKFKTTASDAAVKRYLQQQPAFLDKDGKFDKMIFNAYLKQSRTNEQTLVRDLRKELSYLHIANSVKKMAYAPQALLKKMYQLAKEERGISFVKVMPENIRLEEPTTEELKAYYELSSDAFMVPEMRQITVLKITPDNVASQIAVAPDDVVALVAEKQKQADIPEQRKLAQMRFDTFEKAQKVRSLVTQQNFFKTATEQLGQVDKQTDFGWVSKDEMLEELAEPVFAAKTGTITQPIQSKLGWHILWIREVRAPQKADVNRLRAEAMQQLKREKAYDTMIDLTRQLEDKIGSGDTLALAATDLGLNPQKISDPIDITGKTAQGKSIEAVQNGELLQQLFTLKEGESSSVFETADGYVLASVDKIIPVSQKSYAEVEKQVQQMWRSEQQKKKLPDVAAQVFEMIKNGESNKISSLGNFEHEQIKGTRKAFEKYPAAVVQEIFMQPVGSVNATQHPFAHGFVIGVVESVKTPAWDEKTAQSTGLAEQLQQAIGEELTDDLMAGVLQKNPVNINHAQIKKIFALESAE